MSHKRGTDAREVLNRIGELPADERELIYEELQRQEMVRMTAGTDEFLASFPSSEELLGELSDLKPPTLGEVQAMLLQAVDSRIQGCQKLKEHLGTGSSPVSKDWPREWQERAKVDRDSDKYLAACLKLHSTTLRNEPR